MLDRSFARSAAALLVLVSSAAAQVQLEWDQVPQTAAPYRLRVGAVMPDSAGGWYLTATQNQYSAGPGVWVPLDEQLLRYDAAGTLTGTHSLGAQSGGSPFLVEATGGFWTVLYSAGNGTLRRFDSAAVQHLSVPIPYHLSQVGSIGLAPNGDIVAAGSHSGTAPSSGVSAWRLTGPQDWTVGLVNPNYNNGSVSAMSPTGLSVLARTGPPNRGWIDVVRSDGTISWSIRTRAGLRMNALCFTPTDEVVGVGEDGAGAATILKWDQLGVLEWTYTTALLPSTFRSVAVASDGRIAAVGASSNPMTGTSAALVASIAGDGTHPWTTPWTLSATSSLHRFDRVLFDASGRIVAGGSASLNTPSLQGQLQSAPVIASFSPAGGLSWQFVGASLHNEEICTELHETPSGSFVYSSTAQDLSLSFPIPDSGRVLSVRPQSIVYCSGDGTATACPCGNAGIAGNGCASSANASGANMVGMGTAQISNDTLSLQGTGMPSSSCLYFQGTTQIAGGMGSVFGDGLRCAGGTVVRLGTKINVGGASQYPVGAELPISQKGIVTFAGTRTYQCWYRNAAAFCTPSTFNLTNGLEVTWAP